MELVIILLVLVMLFGATRLADLGGSLGKGIKEFRKEISSGDDDNGSQTSSTQTAAPEATSAGAATVVTNGNGAEVVSAVKCPSCGALNPTTAKHCNQCGAAIVQTVP
jgi:sec-independent protein translocase protein TatA